MKNKKVVGSKMSSKVMKEIKKENYDKNDLQSTKIALKKTREKKEETFLDLTMDGKVSIVETDKKGKVISSEEIPGEVVLGCLVKTLEEHLDRWESERLFNKSYF